MLSTIFSCSSLLLFRHPNLLGLRGIVLVALSRSPLYYEELLKRNGIDVEGSRAWLRVLDCFTDPLCWKSKLGECGTVKNLPIATALAVNSCKSIQDMDEVLSSIIELGKEVSLHGKGLIVGIDSASEMLRHAPIIRVSSLISSFRSHVQICSMFWSLHTDLLHPQAVSALEYASTMKATIETMFTGADELLRQSPSPSLMEQNLRRGRLFVRAKRRNGRVKLMLEEFCVTNSGVKFSAVSSGDVITAQSVALPAVQFNLQLSEKERREREKVVLPFEHQGNGAEVQIYDGRKPETQCSCSEKGSGEIFYLRDSDDELPDSDEDPDDDLDI